jgi:O-antigen/teichoic acid export membrane protein
MSSTPAEHIIIPDADESAPVEYTDAQAPIVLEYEPPKEDSLKKKAVWSSLWTLVMFGVGQVIRFVSNPILAYLLVPEYFGVVSLVSVFVTALQALSDVGIEQAIIQNKRGDEPVFLNTAWTIHAVRGVFLWLGTCVIAWPLAKFFNQPLLTWLMPVAGVGPLLSGFNSTSMFTLNRHLKVGRLTLVMLVYQVINVVVTIAWAYRWPSPWAIVMGGLASNLFFLVISHFLIAGYRNRFCWDSEVRRELMKFGKWIMVSTLITYTAMQIDRPMVGKLQGVKWLGLYGIALNLVALPREIIGRLASVTLFPALARAAENGGQDLGRILRRARGLILSVSLAATLGVFLGAPLFIMIFYKQEYHQAGWLAQLASIGAWFILLQVSADRALLAQGKTKPLATSNAVNLVVTVAAALIGRHIDMNVFGHEAGIVGFMLGLAAGKMAGHLMIQIEMAKSGMSIFRQDTFYTVVLAVLCVVGLLLPSRLPGYDREHMVMYTGIVAVAVCAVTCSWAGIRVIRGIR